MKYKMKQFQTLASTVHPPKFTGLQAECMNVDRPKKKCGDKQRLYVRCRNKPVRECILYRSIIRMMMMIMTTTTVKYRCNPKYYEGYWNF